MRVRKSLITTSLSQLIGNAVNVVVLLMAADELGKTGMGIVSLILLCISFMVIVSGFAGGGSIVYLASRIKLNVIVSTTYLVSLIGAIIVPYLFIATNQHVAPWQTEITLLGLFSAWGSINAQLLLGYQKILLYNIFTLSQPFGMISGFLIGIHGFRASPIDAYLLGLAFSYGLSFFISLSIFSYHKIVDPSKHVLTWRSLFKLGFQVQMANMAQFFNYRLSFLVVEEYFGLAVLGVFSLAVQCAEWIWKIPKSFAIVQYARVASINDRSEQHRLTIKFIQASLLIAFVLSGFVALVPEKLIIFFIGEEYMGIKNMLLFLLPGVILFTIAITTAPLFSGKGSHWVNASISMAVLLFTAIILFVAAEAREMSIILLAVSLSYVASAFLSVVFLKKREGISPQALLPKQSDIKDLFRWRS